MRAGFDGLLRDKTRPSRVPPLDKAVAEQPLECRPLHRAARQASVVIHVGKRDPSGMTLYPSWSRPPQRDRSRRKCERRLGSDGTSSRAPRGSARNTSTFHGRARAPWDGRQARPESPFLASSQAWHSRRSSVYWWKCRSCCRSSISSAARVDGMSVRPGRASALTSRVHSSPRGPKLRALP